MFQIILQGAAGWQRDELGGDALPTPFGAAGGDGAPGRRIRQFRLRRLRSARGREDDGSPSSARGFARSGSTGQARRPGVDGAGRHRIPAILFKRLRRVPDESLPSEEEEVVAAKSAPAGFEEPVESRLDGISGAYASEIDRSAMRTARREQPCRGADHHPVSAFSVLSAAGLA